MGSMHAHLKLKKREREGIDLASKRGEGLVVAELVEAERAGGRVRVGRGSVGGWCWVGSTPLEGLYGPSPLRRCRSPWAPPAGETLDAEGEGSRTHGRTRRGIRPGGKGVERSTEEEEVEVRPGLGLRPEPSTSPVWERGREETREGESRERDETRSYILL